MCYIHMMWHKFKTWVVIFLQDDDDMGVSQLGQKTQYTAPLNVLNDLAQDKVITLCYLIPVCKFWLELLF